MKNYSIENMIEQLLQIEYSINSSFDTLKDASVIVHNDYARKCLKLLDDIDNDFFCINDSITHIVDDYIGRARFLAEFFINQGPNLSSEQLIYVIIPFCVSMMNIMSFLEYGVKGKENYSLVSIYSQTFRTFSVEFYEHIHGKYMTMNTFGRPVILLVKNGVVSFEMSVEVIGTLTHKFSFMVNPNKIHSGYCIDYDSDKGFSVTENKYWI